VSDERAEIEGRIVGVLSAGDRKGAATELLRAYGAEIFGFLMATLRDETAANDAFSRFSEDLWRGLPGYEARATLRVWAYTIARHAALRERAAPYRKRERNLPLDAEGAVGKLGELAQAIRTETAPFLRTEFKTKIEKLREQLSEDERTLLVLRVDRGLEWIDIARVFLSGDELPSEASLSKESAKLRKRFQLVKDKLRRLASETP
jgi:RNA polymerase sigma-70 factor (ECF subfamily)